MSTSVNFTIGDGKKRSMSCERVPCIGEHIEVMGDFFMVIHVVHHGSRVELFVRQVAQPF